VKRRAERQGVARHDIRVGGVVAKRDHTATWLNSLDPETLKTYLKRACGRAFKDRGVSMKQQCAANGKAKAPLREIKLAKKRWGREKKAAELARLTAVVRATTYSELKPMNNQDLADQLKHLKLVLGRDIKKTSLLNRKAYVILVQTLLFTEFGVGANNLDLEDCDDGYGGDGVRKRKASKRKGTGKLIKYLGFEWYANEEFEIDHLIDHMIADGGIVPGARPHRCGRGHRALPGPVEGLSARDRHLGGKQPPACCRPRLWLLGIPTETPPFCISRTRLGSPSAASTSSAARRRPRRATTRRRRGRRRRGRRRRKSPWTTRDAEARVHTLPSRSSGRLQSSSIEGISGDKSLLFLADVPRVCTVCGLRREETCT